MFLEGETLPTPCLTILNKKKEEKREDADGSSLCGARQPGLHVPFFC